MSSDRTQRDGSSEPEERDPRTQGPPPREVLVGVTQREPRYLQAFFDRYFDLVHGLSYRLIGGNLCEDVTQEVFFKVHRAAHQLDPDRDPRYWLTAITYNTCREFWRSGAHKLSQRTVSIDDSPEVGVRAPDRSRNPEEELLRLERERSVQNAIQQLAEPLRVAVVLHDYQGLGHEEVATITGVTHAAARKRYSRALAELAKLLKPKWV